MTLIYKPPVYKSAASAHHSAMRKLVQDDREPWDEDDDAERQTKALAAFALILALAVLGFYLIVQLRAVGKVEDCLLAQHNDCDALIDAR